MTHEEKSEKEWCIRTLQRTTHKLTYPGEDLLDERKKFVADGYLVGKFDGSTRIGAEQYVVFTGDFVGFFEEGHKYFKENQSEQSSVYFEGRIENFKLVRQIDEQSDQSFEKQKLVQEQVRQVDMKNKVRIRNLQESLEDIAAVDKQQGEQQMGKTEEEQEKNGAKQGERVKIVDKLRKQFDKKLQIVDDSEFVGYFRGHINPLDKHLTKRKELKFQQFKERSIILPVFTSFVLKKISRIDLDKTSADVYGTMKIQVQLSDWLIECLKKPQYKDLKIKVILHRQCSIELPLNSEYFCKAGQINKDFNKGLFDIATYFDETSKIISYTVRKKFHAKLDGSYRQFFAPLNLVNINLSLKFSDIVITLPQGEYQEEKIKIKFLCYDFKDYNEDKYPFCSSNDFQDEEFMSKKQKQINRATKVTFDSKMSTGQYFIATGFFTIFPYYCENFANSNNQGGDIGWNLGTKEYYYFIKDPDAKSIKESYQKHALQADTEKPEKHQKLFRYREWNRVHIRIPAYKSWIIIVIQIFFPMILLSVLSLFVFSQENGLKSSDGTSTVNSRIANIASIMIAFVALIPAIKLSGPKAINISFVYIAILLSVVPNFLALISSLIDRNITNQEWKSSYRAFKDELFLISFSIQVTLFLLVIILLIHFIRKTYVLYPARYKKQDETHLEADQSEVGHKEKHPEQSLGRKKPFVAFQHHAESHKGLSLSPQFQDKEKVPMLKKKKYRSIEEAIAPEKFLRYIQGLKKNRAEQFHFDKIKKERQNQYPFKRLPIMSVKQQNPEIQ